MAVPGDLWRLQPFPNNLSHKPVTGHDRFLPLASAVARQKLQLISRKQEVREARFDIVPLLPG